MPSDIDFYNTYQSLAETVSRTIATGSPGVDPEDIEQEIWLDMYQPGKITTLTGMPKEYVKRVMWRAGNVYAEKERLAFIYNSSQWVYTPLEVRALFEEAFFDPIHWEQAPQKDDGYLINAKNVAVCLWDLDTVYSSLGTEDQFAIVSRYGKGDVPISSADKMRLSRAIDKVTKRLNSRVVAKTSDTYEFEED